MKRLLIAVICFFVASAALAQISVRPITRNTNIRNLYDNLYTAPVTWSLGESLRYDVIATDGRDPIDLAGPAFPVLYVAAETNAQTVYMVQTGTIYNATSGHVRVEVAAEDALLPTNQNLIAYMMVYRTRTTGVEAVTIDYTAAQVLPNPAGVQYDLLAPTNPPFVFNIDFTGFVVDWDSIAGKPSVFEPDLTAFDTDDVTEGSTNLFFTDARAVAAIKADGDWNATEWDTAYGWGNAATQDLAAAWSGYSATQTVDLASNAIEEVTYIDFDTAYENGIAEGRLQWNTDAEKLEYGLVDGGLTLKIGDANVMRVRASENILKGQVVSASGQTGNARPNAILSDADSTNLTRRVPTGIALQNINQNQSGYIVTAGLADGMNTTGFPADVPLFLSTTPGGLATNKPAYPYDGWYVAESVLDSANSGQFVVNIVPCKRWEDLDGRYATGTPVYVESDPIWTAASSLYYTASQSDALFITSAPVLVESDPVWAAASNLYATTAGVAAAYLPLAGGTMTGDLAMDTNKITFEPNTATAFDPAEISVGTADMTIKAPTRTAPGGNSGNLVLIAGNSPTSGVAAGSILLSSDVQASLIRGNDNTGASTAQRSVTLRAGSGTAGGAGNVTIAAGTSPSAGKIILDGTVEADSSITATGRVQGSEIGIMTNTLSVSNGMLYVNGIATDQPAVTLSNALGTAAFTASTNYESAGAVAVLSNVLGTAAFTASTNYETAGAAVALSNALGTAAFTATTSYYTKVQADALFATGTPVYAESDPVWAAASNLYATTAGVAAAYLPLSGGTMSGSIDLDDNDLTTVNTIDAAAISDQNGSVVIDLSDKSIAPAFTFKSNLTVVGTMNASTVSLDRVKSDNNAKYIDFNTGEIISSTTPWEFDDQPIIPGYLTSTEAAAIYATGTPVYVETDPIWAASSDLYATTAGVAAAYLPLAGGTMSGFLDMSDQPIFTEWTIGDTNTGRIIDFSSGIITGQFFAYQLGISGDLLFIDDNGKKIKHNDGNVYIGVDDDQILYGAGNHRFLTNSTVYFDGDVIASDIYVNNSSLGSMRISEASSKGVMVGSSGTFSTVYIRPSDQNETIGIRGGSILIRDYSNDMAMRLSPEGIYNKDGDLILDNTGKITFSTNTVSELGIVTAQTVTASFIGDGSGLTNVTGYATTQRVAAIEAQTSNWNSAYAATTNLGTMAYTATGDYYTAAQVTNLLTGYATTGRVAAIEANTSNWNSAYTATTNLGTMAYTSTGDYYTITATTNLLTGYATTNAAALIESDIDTLEASTNNWNAAYNATTNIGTMAYTDTNNYYTTIEADALFVATNDTTVALDGVTLSNGFVLASGAVLNGFNTDTRTATNTWNFGGLEVDGDEVYHEGNFNASLYVTVASFQANLTNYAKRVAVPASNTAYGVAGQYAVGTTNVYFYVPGTNRWGRVPMTLEW